MAVIWVTLGVLAVCGVFGWRAGVVKRLIELAGVLVAVLVTARFAAGLAPWLSRTTGLDDTAALVLGNVLMFVAALVVIRIVAGAVSKFVQWSPLGWLDRIGGALCGVLLGALVASVGLIAVSQAPGGDRVRAAYVQHPVGDVSLPRGARHHQGAHELLGGRVDG
ncbi:MAG: CvpA family protein [Candidatus Krumholzibacteriia bacterium]